MILLRLLPVILSFWLLGAHFLRGGLWLLTAACAAFPLLLLVRRSWVPLLMQFALFLAALEWIRTLMLVAAARLAVGQPWLRMAVIIGSVALISAASSLAFTSAPLRRRYRLTPETAAAGGIPSEPAP